MLHKRFLLTFILSAICFAQCLGCATLSQPAQAMPAAPAPTAEVRWRTSQDYYALLELVDREIDPEWNHGVSKSDVIKYIGQGLDDPDTYPDAGPDTWVYDSIRAVPVGAVLIVEFGKDGFVKSIDWVSE